MPVTIIKDVIIPGGDSATHESSAKSYTITRKIIASGPSTADEIQSLCGYAIGSAGPNGGNLKTREVTHASEGPLAWNLTLTYSLSMGSLPGGGGGGGSFISKVRWSSWSQERVAQHDSRGAADSINPNHRGAFVNAAGDMLDPLPSVTMFWPRVEIDISSAVAEWGMLEMIGVVNSAPWTLFGYDYKRFCVRLSDFKIQQVDSARWLNTYTFDFCFAEAPPNHDLLGETITGYLQWMLNAGFNEVFDGKKRPIYLGKEPASTPQLLTAAGANLNIVGGSAADYPPNYLDFMPHRLADFTSQFVDIPSTAPY